MTRQLILLLWLGLGGVACAQSSMEIIPLRHRTVEQVLPVLQPLVEPGGTLSGMNDQLIVRTSRRNLEDLKKALAAIDLPARRLVIHVSQNREMESRQQGVEVSGNVGLGDNVRVIQPSNTLNTMSGSSRIEVRRGGSNINVQAMDAQRSGEARTGQSVQVVDGGQAFIQVGQSLPMPMRQVVRTPGGVMVNESVVYRDIGQGFYAVPRVVGERVTLEISPQFDTPGGQGYGSVNTQRLTTTISGRLGEWIELGGSNQQAMTQGRGNLGGGTGEMRDSRSIWLRVEELR